MHDAVNHPSHYASGGIECVDRPSKLRSAPEEFQGYLRGNGQHQICLALARKGRASGSSEGELVFDQTFGKH